MHRNSTRRELLKTSALAAAGSLSYRTARAEGSFRSRRPAPSARKFFSRSVEATLVRVKQQIADPELAWLFENAYPNTLDTTVNFGAVNGEPDTFVITGDIDAMWLRDSSAQVWPYLPIAKEDANLRRMLSGLIRRQTACILIDPYANAFVPNTNAPPLSWAVHDLTTMKPGVGERKWEVDSLCYPIRLAYEYWTVTGDASPFDERWRKAAALIVSTFREQQRKNGPGPYKFQRVSETPTETQFLGGYGNPTRPNGMIHSMFRPSDDACLYPLLVPSNLFATVSLRKLSKLAISVLNDTAFAEQCSALAVEIAKATEEHGRIRDSSKGEVWAYEIDGYGDQLFMDDANIPGLLSLPYLGCCALSDPVYQRTRARVWSGDNPYFFRGTAAEGIGGPHEGLSMIWPMSIIMRALTSTDDGEILQCLRWLKSATAETGFIHESFQKDDPAHFTRSWFAWANSLFGELILTLSERRPQLLRSA